MEIRIGLGDAMREIELEMDDGTDQAKVIEEFAKAQSGSESLWWLTDRKGKKVGVPVNKILFIEVGPNKEQRKVGFSA
ncbi:MAG: DUF3107 domain-containing protein [Ferrimicrobium sp.]|uniref:DUF3107 domain-containing protein n=1 Tax=Ferrimicrobium sp. TaxID=2926050 RepID=UPI00262B4625|nr:DUF3107 domain-containing protein [Ferrimicrobium sp.]